MLETHEDDITHWYFGDQNENLLDWLCVERILNEDEQGTIYITNPKKIWNIFHIFNRKSYSFLLADCMHFRG